MVLVFNCKNCKSTNRITKRANDRVELSRFLGDTFVRECRFCGEKEKYSVNDVYATKGLWSLIFICTTVISIIFISTYLYDSFTEAKNVQAKFLLPIGIAIPPIVYFVWLQGQKKLIRNFNRFF